MKLYLFRHGETKQSKFKLEYASEELTARILPEATPVIRKIGKYLKDIDSDGNFSSEYLRCVETVEIIEKVSGKKFVATPLLNEYVEGEFPDLLKRGQEFLKMCLERNYQSAAVCTHGAMVACLTNLITKRKFELGDLFNYPKTGVVWEVTEKGFKEMGFN